MVCKDFLSYTNALHYSLIWYFEIKKGSSWSYGSWIYNDLCYQGLSLLAFESRSNEVYSMQQYVIKFVSDLWQVGGFHRVLRQ
jgi:hypothetical protein